MSPRTVTAEPVVTSDQFLSIDTTGQFSLVASFPEDKTPDFNEALVTLYRNSEIVKLLYRTEEELYTSWSLLLWNQ